MRILFFGTYDERTHPRIEVLREGLLAHGCEIEVCNRPAGVSTAERIELARRPWRLVGRAIDLVRLLWRLRRDAKAVGTRPDAVVVGYLGVFDVHLARRWFDAPVVLDHMAPVAGTFEDRGLGGARSRVASWIDRRAVNAADIVVVDTPEHLGIGGDEPVVVPVGAGRRWFEARRTHDDSDRRRIVFFGLYTPLQGCETIARAIVSTGDRFAWTLVGDGQDRAEVERILTQGGAQVTMVDWVDAEQLPAAVADHDICLGIFGTTPKAARVVPNKVFQGAAAGCVIVTADTAPQRRALGDAAVFVPAGEADALARALTDLDEDQVFQPLRARSRAHADDAFTPHAVVEPLVRALQAHPRPGDTEQ